MVKRKRTSNKMFSNKSKKSKFSASKATALFQELQPQDGVADLEGIALLGEKLGMEDVTEDVRILFLLWKIDPKKPGLITEEEFMEYCTQNKIDSWDSFVNLLPELDVGFLVNSEFRDFYRFCFKFNLSGTHKSLDVEVVQMLLPMVLKDRKNQYLDSFCEFLQAHEKQYPKITLDQWTSFLDFGWEMESLDLYDESTSAWPVLMDEYVEYMQTKKE